MKVLQVINSLEIGGGAEKLVLDLALLLKKRGIHVEVLSIKNPYLSSNGSYCDILKRQGIPVHFLNNSKFYAPINIYRCYRFLKNNKYDIVHSHLFPTLYIVAGANCRSSFRTTLIATEHATTNNRRSILLFKLLDKLVYKSYSQVICISEGTKESLNLYLNQRMNMIVINNGIDNVAFYEAEPISIKSLLKVNNTPFLILQIASFRKAKDQDTLIHAMTYLPNDIHVAFAGDGERISLCKKIVEKLNLQNRVHFLGVRNDLPCIIKSADVVVVSSHWEGFGLAAVEGMASGKPVVASNVKGLAEVVRGAGMLFEQGDFAELARLILQLKNDKLLYISVSEKCIIRAEKYNIKRMTNEYENVYSNYKSNT
ncbi:MAG: glycosyltransferase [Bacteroidetes bacterium]|nr:glycosyltransferase [Bacteroidota bacterium]